MLSLANSISVTDSTRTQSLSGMAAAKRRQQVSGQAVAALNNQPASLDFVSPLVSLVQSSLAALPSLKLPNIQSPVQTQAVSAIATEPRVNTQAIGDPGTIRLPNSFLPLGNQLLAGFRNDPAIRALNTQNAGRLNERGLAFSDSRLFHRVFNDIMFGADHFDANEGRGVDASEVTVMQAARRVALAQMGIRDGGQPLSPQLAAALNARMELMAFTLYHERSGNDLTALSGSQRVNRAPLPLPGGSQANKGFFDTTTGMSLAAQRTGISPLVYNYMRMWGHAFANVSGTDNGNDPLALSVGKTNDHAVPGASEHATQFRVLASALDPDVRTAQDSNKFWDATVPRVLMGIYGGVPMPTIQDMQNDVISYGQQNGLSITQMRNNIAVNNTRAAGGTRWQQLAGNLTRVARQFISDHPNISTAAAGAGAGGLAAIASGCPYMGVLTAGMAMTATAQQSKQLRAQSTSEVF